MELLMNLFLLGGHGAVGQLRTPEPNGATPRVGASPPAISN